MFEARTSPEQNAMGEVNAPPPPGAALGWLAPLGARLLAIAAVLASGFRAVSDDDFARVVLAQEFAQHPKWDASGSSWLPFPFWLTGSVMRLFGSDLLVARGLTLCLSVASTYGVWLAARWAGLTRREACVAATVTAILPHAVWLSVATVPEGFCAVLCLLAVCSTGRTSLAVRAAGAVCVTLAAWSRYEAWPIAVLCCGYNLFDAVRRRDVRFVTWALAACVGPVSWCLHGALHHDSALFFVTRVANYRRALGQSPGDAWQVLGNYPLKLLSAEPELIGLSVALALVARFRATHHGGFAARQRLQLASALLIFFLTWGDLRDGAPTHHAERPLLFAWLALALVCAKPLRQLLQELLQERSPLLLACVALGPLAGLGYRITLREPCTFQDRESDVNVGRELQRVVGSERVLIVADDYRYLAVVAGLNRPGQSVAYSRNDPRRALPAWASEPELRAALQRDSCQWIATGSEHEALIRPIGHPLETRGGWLWARIELP